MTSNLSALCDVDAVVYVGRKVCGCVVAVMVDEPDARETSAHFHLRVGKALAKWEGSGLTVERATVQDIHNGLLRRCQCPLLEATEPSRA